MNAVESQNLLARWKERNAFLRDEEHERRLRADNEQHGYQKDSPTASRWIQHGDKKMTVSPAIFLKLFQDWARDDLDRRLKRAELKKKGKGVVEASGSCFPYHRGSSPETRPATAAAETPGSGS